MGGVEDILFCPSLAPISLAAPEVDLEHNGTVGLEGRLGEG